MNLDVVLEMGPGAVVETENCCTVLGVAAEGFVLSGLDSMVAVTGRWQTALIDPEAFGTAFVGHTVVAA